MIKDMSNHAERAAEHSQWMNEKQPSYVNAASPTSLFAPKGLDHMAVPRTLEIKDDRVVQLQENQTMNENTSLLVLALGTICVIVQDL